MYFGKFNLFYITLHIILY